MTKLICHFNKYALAVQVLLFPAIRPSTGMLTNAQGLALKEGGDGVVHPDGARTLTSLIYTILRVSQKHNYA